MATDVERLLGQARQRATAAELRAGLIRDDLPAASRSRRDAAALGSELGELRGLLAELSAAVNDLMGPAKPKAEANGKASASGHPAAAATKQPAGPDAGCECLGCTVARAQLAAAELQRRRQAATAARPHLHASGVPHASSPATMRDCADKGCAICRDALGSYGAGEEPVVMDAVRVYGMGFWGFHPTAPKPAPAPNTAKAEGLSADQFDDALNGRR